MDDTCLCYSFARVGRLTNSHSESSFLGRAYYEPDSSPAPGQYETAQSTLSAPIISKTRPSNWSRRSRNCRPMLGQQAALSLYGADTLAEDHSPCPGSYATPQGCFTAPTSGWSAQFSSQTGRFPPTRRAVDTEDRPCPTERRRFHRPLPHSQVARARRRALNKEAAAVAKKKTRRASPAKKPELGDVVPERDTVEEVAVFDPDAFVAPVQLADLPALSSQTPTLSMRYLLEADVLAVRRIEQTFKLPRFATRI